MSIADKILAERAASARDTALKLDESLSRFKLGTRHAPGLTAVDRLTADNTGRGGPTL